MNIQKINWKLFIADPTAASPEAFFKVFNAWIPDSPEIYIDVADYQHAHDGPLTILVGHHSDFWLDATDRRLGLLYNRRTPMEGNNPDKLASTLRDTLTACERLRTDAAFGGKLAFRTDEIHFTINDRGLAPNTRETFDAVRPDLVKLMTQLVGGNYKLERLTDPKRRFTVRITTNNQSDLKSLLQRIPA